MNLSSLPALGFETTICNANAYLGKENFYDLKENISSKEQDATYRNFRVNRNIIKIVGYIPIIGTIVGLFRIALMQDTENKFHKLPNVKNHMIRGCIEVCSLGILLLIPDLIITAYRNFPDLKMATRKI